MSDGAAWMADGELFRAREAATGTAGHLGLVIGQAEQSELSMPTSEDGGSP